MTPNLATLERASKDTGYNVTVTDLFAGAGGSSSGMVQVPGVHVRYAANHWKTAVAIHNANHPLTDHAAVDLHQEDPRFFATTDILWASPECTKWSQANGTARPAIEEGLFEDPLSSDAATRSRLLMFDVLRFAEHHRYRYMVIENVIDIATQPKYRMAWFEWRKQLRGLGYKFQVVSLNSMHAQTHGDPAPQSRDRIYIVCWREGERAPDLDRVTRTRAYCSKCDQVVDAAQSWKNGKEVGRYKQTYVFTHTVCGTVVEPGWLPAAHAIDWSIPGQRIGDMPLKEYFDKKTKDSLGFHPKAPKTLVRITAGIARHWVPQVIEAAGNTYDAADPKHDNHGDPNAYYRATPVTEPLRTLHTTSSKAFVQPPLMDKLYGTGVAHPVTDPAATFTAGGNHHALITPSGGTWAEDSRLASRELPTLTTRDSWALVTSYYGNANGAKPTTSPLGTLTTHDRHALIHRNNSGGAEMTTPVTEELRTLTTKGSQSLLHPGELDLGIMTAPRRKVTQADLKRAREIVPEVMYRMLRPHEVAAGQAFPRDYDWHPDPTRPTNNTDLVKAAGNAVPPPCARDIIWAVVEALTGEAVLS